MSLKQELAIGAPSCLTVSKAEATKGRLKLAAGGAWLAVFGPLFLVGALTQHDLLHRDAAQHGGYAELWKDGALIARARPAMLKGHRWPDRSVDECDLRDVLKSLLQLLRSDDWDAKELAQAMTAYGLPTTRSRIDALRGSTAGKRTEVTAAELVVMMNSVLNAHKNTPPQA